MAHDQAINPIGTDEPREEAERGRLDELAVHIEMTHPKYVAMAISGTINMAGFETLFVILASRVSRQIKDSYT